DVPLILAAAEPSSSLYRSMNSYDGLLDETIPGNPENASDEELAGRSREVLDKYYARQLDDLIETVDRRRGEGRASTDLSDLARASTNGAVDTLLVDLDASVPGSVSADGAVTFDDSDGSERPGVLDEISRRVLLTGGEVLVVRSDELPDGAQAVATLRYAP